MIEMPEAATLARQMQETLPGKTVSRFARGPLTHKFLWLNRPDAEYAALLAGRTITHASHFGRSLYLHFASDLMLWWGDAGGKILYHAPAAPLPKKHHLLWQFSDGSHLTYSLEMWGYCKLLDNTQFSTLPHDEKGIQPLTPLFTFERFNTMLDGYPEKGSKGIKGFLVATGYAIPDPIQGLGNAFVQDILFHARLDPRRKIPTLDPASRRALYDAIQTTLTTAVAQGGRDDEVDLFGQPGGYHRLMDSRSAGTPCPVCGTIIEKIAYLGGACYLCPSCQK